MSKSTIKTKVLFALALCLNFYCKAQISMHVEAGKINRDFNVLVINSNDIRVITTIKNTAGVVNNIVMEPFEVKCFNLPVSEYQILFSRYIANKKTILDKSKFSTCPFCVVSLKYTDNKK